MKRRHQHRNVQSTDRGPSDNNEDPAPLLIITGCSATANQSNAVAQPCLSGQGRRGEGMEGEREIDGGRERKRRERDRESDGVMRNVGSKKEGGKERDRENPAALPTLEG